MNKIDQIYEEHGEMIYKYLMAKCSNIEIAEEITQETFYQAVKSIDRYDGSCKISTWLCQIANHLLYREYERRKRNKSQPLSENFMSTSDNPETICLENESKIYVMKAIHRLDNKPRELILLRLTGNLSFREIGMILGESENWARVNFFRAKKKLRKELSDEV